MIQVNKTDVYVVGGRSKGGILCRDYDVMSSCLCLNVETNVVKQRSSMNQGRYANGACNIGALIYVLGGKNFDNQIIESCEVYNVSTDKWNKIPDVRHCSSMTTIAVRKRYLFGFGCFYTSHNLRDKTIERFFRLDSYKLQKGWQTIKLANPFTVNGFQYGVIPLTSHNTTQ